MIDIRKSAWLMAPAALLIAGCSDETAPVAEEGEAEASGEVLEGTISDAMLPVDRVRSQAPQADPEPAEGEAPSSSPDSSESAEAETTEPAIQPVPGIEIAEPADEAGESESVE